ncbi:uncharacterized protein LOC142987422 isoform X2 [Anticarsia gemmatalis]|uniref:uncharacterized protein LOC142987422 isoform X2 n=1 Tax=Anticarsia gemmatalis TaxID=129554 RepID=UPI003F762779
MRSISLGSEMDRKGSLNETYALTKRVQRIKEVFESISPGVEVEWDKATLIMEPRPGLEVLFLYARTPGAFRALVKKERRNKVRPHPEPLITFADVRMKLVDRWMGMMCCEDLTAYALVRVDELPTTEQGCVRAAAKLGYSAPGGRSYLYIKNKMKEEEL